ITSLSELDCELPTPCCGWCSSLLVKSHLHTQSRVAEGDLQPSTNFLQKLVLGKPLTRVIKWLEQRATL
ncbi:MAG: hypothetical protein ACE5K8_10680, partial [Candidatus Zixiibacteriota bacterium]